MVQPFILIGLLIAADSILGYQLGIDRARRREGDQALSAYEQGAVDEAFRHWALVTVVASVAGGGVGVSWGPGFLEGMIAVAGASVFIAFPVTYLAGLFYVRRAAKLIEGQ